MSLKIMTCANQVLCLSRYVFSAWVYLYAYPASEAPAYKVGYKVNAALWGVYLVGMPVILWFSKTFPMDRHASPSDDDVEAIEYSAEVEKETSQ